VCSCDVYIGDETVQLGHAEIEQCNVGDILRDVLVFTCMALSRSFWDKHLAVRDPQDRTAFDH
jgi:hypothetical protein